MNYAEESLRLHGEWKGKIEVISRVPVKDKEDLGLANVAATVVTLLGYEPPKEWLEPITK